MSPIFFTKPIFKINIQVEKDTCKVGQKIYINREIVNLTNKDAYLDQDSVNMGFEFKDSNGKRIEGWPHTDRLEKPGGADSYLKVEANGTFTSRLEIRVEDKEWIGFGVPKGFTGPAFSVFRTAGESIYKIDKIPGDYRIKLLWQTNDNVDQRAKKYGFKNVFKGQIESNEISVEIVE